MSETDAPFDASLTGADIARLSRRLSAVSPPLDDEDRRALAVVFALAGRAVREDIGDRHEVAGFAAKDSLTAWGASSIDLKEFRPNPTGDGTTEQFFTAMFDHGRGGPTRPGDRFTLDIA